MTAWQIERIEVTDRKSVTDPDEKARRERLDAFTRQVAE